MSEWVVRLLNNKVTNPKANAKCQNEKKIGVSSFVRLRRPLLDFAAMKYRLAQLSRQMVERHPDTTDSIDGAFEWIALTHRYVHHIVDSMTFTNEEERKQN